MRLIDADALMTWFDDYYDDEEVTVGFISGWIKNQPTVEPQQWIPVTERLPEKNGDYYVTYEKGYAEDYGFDLVGIAPYDADCEGFGIWQERYDPVSLGYLDSYFVDIKVTAWMPYIRPEPWEGGAENEKDKTHH